MAAHICAVIVVFAVPLAVQAQTAGPAPRGQVLQATDSCPPTSEKRYTSPTTGTVTSAISVYPLTITPDKKQAATGETVNVGYSVKPECASKLAPVSSYQIRLHHGAFDSESPEKDKFSTTQNSPSTGQVPLLVSTNNFAPGDHLVSVVMVMPERMIGGIRHNDFFVGSFQFTVGASAAVGKAQLQVQFVGSGVEVGRPYYEYSFSYTPGATKVDAKSISIHCGGGAIRGDNPIAYGTGSANARCLFDYPEDGKPKDYTLTFKALDSNAQPIPDAEAVAKVTVTGKESNSATSVPGKNDSALLWIVNVLIGGIMKALVEILHLGAVTVGSLMEKVLSVQTFSDEFAQTIYDAWEIFRNLGNIVFILAIVAIGVATVFRISQYQVKDLLVKLILGAILINFSLTIAQAVLGVSDTLQQQFLSDNSGALRSIINTLFVSDIWSKVPDATLGDFATTARILAQFFISFAAFFAILGIGILVCVRLVMLWLLLMLSPVPYVAMVLPMTRKYASQWWSQFINWAAVTPAVGFMLNLTALMTTKNRDVIERLAAKSELAQSSSWLNDLAFAVATNVIPLIFLYMTLQVATSFGKGAGGFVTKSLNKVSGMAFAPAAAMGGFAAGAAKASVDKAKDKAKIGYLDKVTNYLGPKTEGDVKGFKGFVKSGAFNLATGGSVWEANKKKRKSDLADKQALVGAYAKDARSLAKGETPKAVQALKDSELAKAQKDKKEDIRDNTAAENTQKLADVLNSAASAFGKTVEMLARTDLALEKGSFDDMKKKVVLEYLQKRKNAGDQNAAQELDDINQNDAPIRIERFYEAGADAGMSKRHLEQLRDKVNGKMISDGKLDNVIDPVKVDMVDGSKDSKKRQFAQTDIDANQEFKKKRWEKKSAYEQAANMHADMFQDPVLVASFLAKWKKLKAPKQADIVAALSREKVNTFAKLYGKKDPQTNNSVLEDALVNKENMTTADAQALMGSFKNSAGF